MKKLIIKFVFMVFFASGSTFAVVSQTAQLSLTIAEVIKLTLQNTSVTFGNWSGVGDLSVSDQICVYDNQDSTYHITFTGSGAASAFTMSKGSGATVQTIVYEVKYKASVAADGVETPVTKGVAVAGTGASTTDASCSTNNATIKVVLRETALQAAGTGSFTGSLSMLIAKE